MQVSTPHERTDRARSVRALTFFASLFFLLLTCGAPATAAEVARLKIPTPEQLEKSIDRGLAFLLQRQNKDGSWGTARNTKDLNIFAPVPGAHHAFRCGVTALCVESLIDTGAADHDPKMASALRRGEEWLLENLPKLRRADGEAIYNVWGHGYGVEALADVLRREKDETRRSRIRKVIESQVELLGRYESVDGGWSYYDFRAGAKHPSSDPTSFTTATVLLALRDAMELGIAVPTNLTARALQSLQRQRKKDNTYVYAEPHKMRPQSPINRAAGSLGRSQACNLALRRFGDASITDAVITNWLGRLIVRNEWLGFGRKRPVPHESWFQVAGYFYYYGHYYAALCSDQLKPEDARPYRRLLAATIVPLQEKDGSWWDFPFYDYHQPYGTAFALMTLARCREP